MSRHHVSATASPCPRCLPLGIDGTIRFEMVQPVPDGAWAPLGHNRIKCCYDCASADTLMRLGDCPTWEAARIAVGTDRQDQYRMPGAPMGLVEAGLVRPSETGDLERHHAWLNWLQKARPELAGLKFTHLTRYERANDDGELSVLDVRCPYCGAPEGKRCLWVRSSE
jgi:hypothetical protein